MNAQEAALRQALGIPTTATSVLILEQSAHCDWDWLATFRQYYGPGGADHQAVRTTLEQAIQYIGQGQAGLPYTYVFCEVAYLQAFMNDPSVAQDVKDQLSQYAGKQFLFASGGITSAENLLVHPEAFIRNYLLGRQWLDRTFGATVANGAVSNQLWIPDDFGHDAQLPALLQAMGLDGAGFWRIPAQCGVYNNTCTSADGTSAAPSTYLPELVGLDFRWQANDGSSVQAHWLSQSYCQGNTFGGGTSIDSPPAVWKAKIGGLISENTTTVMPTPYMFTPIDCDFCIPYDNGPSIFQQWNQDGETTWVTQASFEDYMQLVAAAAQNGNGTSSLQTLSPHPASDSTVPPFIPNPYYAGCYASKPYLKITHYQTVRILLLTESMQLLLKALGDRSAAGTALTMLSTAWNLLAPSTHHDYITGTAPNAGCDDGSEDVYDDEQVKLLDKALSAAQEAQDFVLGTLAGQAREADTRVMIFNGLGFKRWAIADLATLPAGGPFSSLTIDGQMFYPVQDDGNGGLLVGANLPPLGYLTAQLSARPPSVMTAVTASQSGDTVTLANGRLTAVIDGSGIVSLETPSGANCFPVASGNQLRSFVDGGSIYRFGYEIPCIPTQFYWDQTLVFQLTSIKSESGPLCATAIVEGTLGGDPFTIRYDLLDGEQALRISVTGSAPSGRCIMAYFELAGGSPVSLTYGTTAHWDNQEPRNFFDWTPPPAQKTELMTFEPTHEYVAPVDATGKLIGAIYHSASPAWGIYGPGVVGCLLRNTPGTQNAACATDPGTYTITYAVEPPDLLQSPGEGAGPGSMLATGLSLSNPPAAYPVTGDGALPPACSIAYSTDDRVILTAAKAGTVSPSQLVLRLYQPANAAIDGVTITIDGLIASGYQSNGLLVASAVNALEQPSTQNLNIDAKAGNITLDLPFAITTVALGE